MHALKQARRLIENSPESEAGRILARLVLALESEGSFELAEIYRLDMPTFQLALQILKEWRLDRYYAGKARLFDMAVQARDLGIAQ